MERVDLTVRLRRDGDNLRRAYSYRPYGHREELDTTEPWDSFGSTVRFEDLSGPEAVAALLDRGKAEELQTCFTRARLADVGEILFDLLFGGDTEKLFRGLFKQPSGPAPNPPRHPVRMRIVTDDPLLAGLPWRVTTWLGRWLMDSGWTFETAVREDAERNVELRAPVKVLAVLPGGGEPLGEEAHFEDLREALLKVSPHYEDKSFLTRVGNRGELADALRGMGPDAVYYYGHGVVDGGQACLLLPDRGGAPRPLAMGDLRRLFGGSPPQLVYLNACSSAASGWQSAGHQLTPEVACVVAQRTTVWTEAAGAAAVRWFERFLGQGLDPVVALHQLDETTRGFEWTTAVAWTCFGAWTTHRDHPLPPLREVGLRLDRDQQRALALKHVSDLIASQARRLEAMVVYGAKGALVNQFARQLRDYLESRRVCLRWKSLSPAEAARLDFGRLEEELDLWLGRQDFEVMAPLLRRLAPPRGVSDSTPVLCLDWGVFGTEDGRRITEDELREWLLFASDVLARHCPPDVRVVSYLAIEAAEKNHGVLEETMAELQAEIRSHAFRSSLLPALAGVTLTNVLDYLEDSTNTHCPSSLADEAARRIHRRTEGRYEETVALIARGKDDGWHRLLRELREDGDRPPRDRITF